jgi:hypothetical protein
MLEALARRASMPHEFGVFAATLEYLELTRDGSRGADLWRKLLT